MTAQQMALLERLFEEACAISESERPPGLAAHCGDPEVRAELESLALHATRNGDFAAVVNAALHPSHIGPYRVVTMPGEGGMGAVYECVRDDDQFRQTVAIKVLRMIAR